MIGLFKQKSPGNIVVLFIFGLMIKLPLFLSPKNIVATDYDGKLYQWLIGALGSSNGFTASLIALVLIYVQALMLIYLLNEYRMLPRQNYLPGAAYMLLTSLMPEWTYLSAPLVCNTFIIPVFILLFSLYSSPKAKSQVFNIGLLAGVASYVYFPSAIFILSILLGLIILRPFSLNEIVLLLLGCITPYYFYGVTLFLADQLNFKNFFPSISLKVPRMKSSLWLAASTVLLAIPFLMGGFFIQAHLRKMLIQVRKNWSILLIYLLLAFLVPFVNSNQSFYTSVVLVVPFAAFHASAYFYQPHKLVASFLFFITLGYILYLQYGSPTWQ